LAIRTEIHTITKITLDKNSDKDKYEELLKDKSWEEARCGWRCGESHIVGFIKEETIVIEEPGSEHNKSLRF